MLTSFQCEYVAYTDEDGTLFCLDCAGPRLEGAPEVDVDSMFIHYYGIPDPEVTGLFPVIRYSLDEQQSAASEGNLDWNYADEIVDEDGDKRASFNGVWHVEACSCEDALEASGCGHELLEAYVDRACESLDTSHES